MRLTKFILIAAGVFILNSTNLSADEAKMAKGYASTRTRTNLTSVIATDAASGVIALELTATQTAALDAERYVYDVEITQTSTGTVTRVIEGLITVRPNVTT